VPSPQRSVLSCSSVGSMQNRGLIEEIPMKYTNGSYSSIVLHVKLLIHDNLIKNYNDDNIIVNNNRRPSSNMKKTIYPEEEEEKQYFVLYYC